MDELNKKLMKLFILADGAGDLTGIYDYADLFYALLDEIKELQPIYENCEEQLIALA